MIKILFATFFILMVCTLFFNQSSLAFPYNVTVRSNGNQSTFGDEFSSTCTILRDGGCYDFENKLAYFSLGIPRTYIENDTLIFFPPSSVVSLDEGLIILPIK